MVANSNIQKEYILSRCNEIIENDKNHKDMNTEILLMENIFFKSLSQKQQRDYLNIESKLMNLIDYDISLTYRTAINEK
jgi:hypothetical protein